MGGEPMTFTSVIEAIATVGFPIICVIALGWFIYHIYKQSERREEQLHIEIKQYQKTNAAAIETISKYADRLDAIQKDVSDIKQEIIIITERVGG